jgi:hypothetical protein
MKLNQSIVMETDEIIEIMEKALCSYVSKKMGRKVNGIDIKYSGGIIATLTLPQEDLDNEENTGDTEGDENV